MARKVRCPACGARNKKDLDRCRLCGAPLHPEDDQPPPGAEIEVSEVTATPEGDGMVAAVGEAEAAGYEPLDIPAGRAAEPPAPTRDDPVIASSVHFDPDALPIDEEHRVRPGGLLAVNPDEHFDPDELELDRNEPLADEDGPPVLNPREHFDPGDLEVEDPADPKPSS